jgi:hypothetical protein
MSRFLLEAAARGDVAKIEQQLTKGADVNCIHKGTGRTPLIEAVINSQHAAVRMLIEAGANVNHFDKGMGYTALMWACDHGDVETVQLLLGSGADVNARSPKFGWTPLLCAASASLPVVRMLLDAGANPHATKNDGTTAVALAERAKKPEIAGALAASGVTSQNTLPKPACLPWPDVGANAAEVDFSKPATVVRGLIIAMNQFEEAAHLAQGKDEILTLMNGVYGRFCTDKQRPYGRNGSYSRPPEYDPVTEKLIASQVVRAGRAEVVTRSQSQGDRENLYILIKKAGRWLIDSRKTRLVGESEWRNDNI